MLNIPKADGQCNCDNLADSDLKAGLNQPHASPLSLPWRRVRRVAFMTGPRWRLLIDYFALNGRTQGVFLLSQGFPGQGISKFSVHLIIE